MKKKKTMMMMQRDEGRGVLGNERKRRFAGACGAVHLCVAKEEYCRRRRHTNRGSFCCVSLWLLGTKSSKNQKKKGNDHHKGKERKKERKKEKERQRQRRVRKENETDLHFSCTIHSTSICLLSSYLHKLFLTRRRKEGNTIYSLSLVENATIV